MLLIFDDSSKYYHLLDLFWSKNKLATLGIRFENFFDDLFFFVKMVKILPCGYCVYSKHAQNFLKDNLVCIVILKLYCKSIKVV